MNKQTPLVSVIIPAYNAGAFIGEAIESILNQTFTNLECVVIDDCSTDNTGQVISRYATEDSRIILHKNKQNLGVGGNRSLGIRLAKGEFICWQDADDISLPTRIQEQLDYLLAHPKVGIVGGYMEFFGKDTKTSVRRYDENDASLRKKIFRYNPVAQPAAMCRAECFKELGAYNENYKVDEDLEMLFRLGTKYEFANVQSIVLRYRQDKNSLTRSNLKLMELTTIKLRRLYAKNPAYAPTVADYIYNLLQYVSIYLIPARLKIALFNLIRNSS